MIIKDDKVVEPVAEQVAETLPPYSPPQVRIDQADSPSRGPSNAPNFVFRARGSSPGALNARQPALPLVPASSSSTYSEYSGSTVRPLERQALLLPPEGVPRVSFLHVRRENKNISQRITVDPYLPYPPDRGITDPDIGDLDESFGPRFPTSLLPGDPDQRNIRLECADANVTAEVWVIGRNPGDYRDRRKAGIDIRAKNGYIYVQMHADMLSPSFSLRIACKNGGVRIILPRSFSGPLITRSQNGWVSFSSALANCTTSFSEVGGTRKSFVGDFLESGYGSGEWHGCFADITCDNGRINLSYEDEQSKTSSIRSFNRLLG